MMIMNSTRLMIINRIYFKGISHRLKQWQQWMDYSRIIRVTMGIWTKWRITIYSRVRHRSNTWEKRRINTLDRWMINWNSHRSIIEMITTLVMTLLKRYSRISRKAISIHSSNKTIRYTIDQTIATIHKSKYRNYSSRSINCRNNYKSRVCNWRNSSKYYIISSSSNHSSLNT